MYCIKHKYQSAEYNFTVISFFDTESKALAFNFGNLKFESIESTENNKGLYDLFMQLHGHCSTGAVRFRSNEYGQWNLKFIGFIEGQLKGYQPNAMLWYELNEDGTSKNCMITNLYYNGGSDNVAYRIGKFAAVPQYKIKNHAIQWQYSRDYAIAYFEFNEKQRNYILEIARNSYVEEIALVNIETANGMLDNAFAMLGLKFQLQNDFNPKKYKGVPVKPKHLIWLCQWREDSVRCDILLYFNYKKLSTRKSDFSKEIGWHCLIKPAF